MPFSQLRHVQEKRIQKVPQYQDFEEVQFRGSWGKIIRWWIYFSQCCQGLFDGTLKWALLAYSQLYVNCAFWEDRVVSLAFALTFGKTFQHQELFSVVGREKMSLKGRKSTPDRQMTDFDRRVVSATETDLTDTFHLRRYLNFEHHIYKNSAENSLKRVIRLLVVIDFISCFLHFVFDVVVPIVYF